jgi:hypothetical protein
MYSTFIQYLYSFLLLGSRYLFCDFDILFTTIRDSWVRRVHNGLALLHFSDSSSLKLLRQSALSWVNNIIRLRCFNVLDTILGYLLYS